MKIRKNVVVRGQTLYEFSLVLDSLLEALTNYEISLLTGLPLGVVLDFRRNVCRVERDLFTRPLPRPRNLHQNVD